MGVLPIRSVTDSAIPLGKGRGGTSGSSRGEDEAAATRKGSGDDDDGR